VVLNQLLDLCCGATTLSAKAALSTTVVVTKRQRSQVLALLGGERNGEQR